LTNFLHLTTVTVILSGVKQRSLAWVTLWCSTLGLAFVCIAGSARAELTDIRRSEDPGGQERFHAGGSNGLPVFRAIVTNHWLHGLVPIYTVERKNRSELRRRPARGQEHLSEPLFFGLMPSMEQSATSLTAEWEVEATRPDGSRPVFGMQLVTEGTNVSARFDPNTDYRFAHITSGSFVANQLKLEVQHNVDEVPY
jgi:hypothetical protein